ncbi:MAG: transcriptional repressor [Lewinella sp.]
MKNRSALLLKEHGLRVTSFRDKVLQLFLEAGSTALSNSDIEQHFEKVDRITLYRTLRTFEKKGFIHQVIDNSNTPKFASCSDYCTEQHHHDDHAHFHCVECEKTVCFEDTSLPTVKIPSGFMVNKKHMVLSGTCDVCSK